jgi:hypothetical protein
LTSLGLLRPQVLELLTHPSISASQSGKNVLDGLFDASDRPEGGEVITWWNDMEKDSRYVRNLSWTSFRFQLHSYPDTLNGAHPSSR